MLAILSLLQLKCTSEQAIEVIFRSTEWEYPGAIAVSVVA